MEERDTSEVFLSKNTTIPALRTHVTPVNENHQPPACELEFLILNVATLVIAMVGMAGNAVVLWLLGFLKRRNTVSVYILNLAVADFLVLSYQVTPSLYEIITSSSSKFIFIYFLPVMTCSYIAGLSLLSIISIERCLSVLCPIWYHCHRPRHTSTVLCVLLWALSLLLSIMDTNECYIFYIFFKSGQCMTFKFSIAGYLMFLFVTLSESNLVLLFKMFCVSRPMPLTRLCVTLTLTVLVFLFCGLPIGINYFRIFWLPILPDNQPCYYVHLFLFLSSVNSCANPIIYFFIGSFRQRRWQLVLQRALQDSPEVGESGGSLPQGSQEMSVSRVEP